MNYETTRTTRTAQLFIQRSRRPRNIAEQTAYLRAYLLKLEACPPEVIDACAYEMARLIREKKCILIPVPDSNGSTAKNYWLAHAVAKLTGAEVKDILTKSEPTASQCYRHKTRQKPLTPKQLKITVKPHKPFDLRPIYFVDNVITSGATIQACRDALGFGTGLVYAEALRRA